MTTVVEISSDDQFTQLTTSVDASTVVALYFNTPWAEPCKRMTQVYESLASTIDSKKAIFLSINAENFPDISESFDVTAVPYFVLLKNSTIIKELSGADPKELVNTVQGLVNGDKQTTTGGASSSSGQQGVEKSGTAHAESEEEEEETEEELNKRLGKLVKAAPVMLFMKGTPRQPNCGFSRQIVEILRENQVQFGFFDILKDNSVREGLKKFSDWPTFPQLYINGELQGGLDIIKESLADDPNYFENAVAQS